MKQTQTKKRRYKVNWGVLLKDLAVVALACVLLYGISRLPLFNIKTIEAVGNQYVATSKLVNLTEIEIGDNFFTISARKAKKNLELYPWIEKASVKRKFPNRVVIDVEERTPIGYVVTPDGYIQVSADGHMLAIQQSLSDYNLPVISGVELSKLPSLGGVIQDKNFQEVLDILTGCPPQLLRQLAELNVSQKNYIVAYTNQKIEVHLGRMEDTQERLQDLSDIMDEVVRQKIPLESIEYIDIRYKDAPVIKLRGK